METKSNDTNKSDKIGRVLLKFLEPGFRIGNSVYLNLFLTHLADDEKRSQNDNLKDQFCQWIIDASILWDRQKVEPRASILAFALNLAGQLSNDEQVFIKLNCKNVYESLIDVAHANTENEPIVTVGVITLLCSFLEHKNGLQWVVATTHWTDTMNLGLKANLICIRKQASHFVQKLLEKSISFNRNFAINLIKTLIKPLKIVLRSLARDEKTELTEIESKKIDAYLGPTLNFILAVIEPLLKNFNKEVLQLFIQQEVPEVINKYILLSHSEDLSFKLLQIQFVFLLHKLHEKVKGEKEVNHDSPKLYNFKLMFSLIRNVMDKNFVRCVIKICDYAHELFSSLAHRMPRFIKKGTLIEFEVQVMFLQITPFFALSTHFIPDQSATAIYFQDYFRNIFCQQWFEVGEDHNIESGCKWIEQLALKPDLMDDVIVCCQYITKQKKLLNKERVSFIFPALVYSLTDALISLKNGRRVDMSDSFTTYFLTVMETLIDLVESFDLTWKDSLETIRVLPCAYEFLQYSDWNDNLMTIKGLKLLRTAISKYMSPDMVLLMYDNEKSSISKVGGLLYKKCQESSWEIRNSALDVVLELSLNANTKFPAFTNILLNANLPRLVVDMALKDSEYYIRATAFKCLQELMQISEIWDKILETDNKFLSKLLVMFEHESEGIVRKEVAALIFKIDKYQSFPKVMLPRVYDVMTQATIGDLHWEVKYNALDYWFNKWDEHLSDQGMIDRAFPSHTFSKELKKIVALNEMEIRKRIVKVLNQLAEIGCLYAMKCAVKDDSDVEVSKKATDFASDMVKLFKTYEIRCESVDLSPPQVPTVQPNKSPKIQPNDDQNRTLSERVSSVSLGDASDQHLLDDIDLGSPQLLNSPYFDLLSSCPTPYSPLPDENIITLSGSTTSHSTSPSSPSQSSPEQSSPISTNELYTPDSNVKQQAQSMLPEQSSTPNNNVYQQTSQTAMQCTTSFNNFVQEAFDTLSTMQPMSPVNIVNQASPTSEGQSHSHASKSPSNHIASNGNLVNGIDIPNSDISYDHIQLENVVDLNDLIQEKSLLEEFLNSNELMQHNSTDQITDNGFQMKTKTYLAPSEFLKFVYSEVEIRNTMKKAQWINNLDVFDSLLDDILKEYDTTDINRMDYY